AHRGHDHHDLVAASFRSDDALGYALDALRVGYRRTTVFLHDKAHQDAPLLPVIWRTAVEFSRAAAARPIDFPARPRALIFRPNGPLPGKSRALHVEQPPASEGAAERHLVRVLKVAAHRQAAR